MSPVDNQVNTRAAHEAGTARMMALSAQVDALQGQIAIGKRVSVPADDPVAFSRAALLRRAENASDATQRGIDAASRRLTATDAALGSVADIVVRAKELALQGNNATLSTDDRGSLAREVVELAAAAANIAESRGSDGERLFGGAAANGPAYAPDAAGVVRWQGAGRAPGVQVGATVVASGIEGPAAFGTTVAATGTDPASNDVFATLTALGAALAEPDSALRQTALDAALTDLDGHVSRLADARATAGARLERLDSEGQRIASGKLATESDLSKLESLDMTEAIARLQRMLTVLQASQASFVKTSSLSLWDQLR